MSTTAYNPHIEDAQCISIYIWRPASFNSSFFKKVFDNISENYSKLQFQDIQKTAHYAFTYCQRQPQVEWVLNTRLFGIIAFFDGRATKEETETAMEAYQKEREKYKSSLLMEYFVFVDAIDLNDGASELSTGRSNLSMDQSSNHLSSSKGGSYDGSARGKRDQKSSEGSAAVATDTMGGPSLTVTTQTNTNTEKISVVVDGMEVVEDAEAPVLERKASTDSHGRETVARRSSSQFDMNNTNAGTHISHYPAEFLWGLFGYVIVSAQCLKNDFSSALPGIPKALKAVFVNLDYYRKHVESFLVDEHNKTPKSPKARAALRSAPDLSTSFLFPITSANSAPTKTKLKKQLGDVCMLTGCFRRALELYHLCMEQLSCTSDPLWYAAATEGKIAASFVLHYTSLANVSWNERVKSSTVFFNEGGNKLLNDVGTQLRDERYIGLSLPSSPEKVLPDARNRERKAFNEEQMVSAYHNYVLPYYEKKSEGMSMWAEALLRRAMLKQQMGYDRVLVKKSAIHAHKMIDERRLPEHVKIRSDLVTAHLLFKTDFIRQGAFYMYCATTDSALYKSSSKPLAGIRYIHQILPIHLVDLEFGYESVETWGGWAALHCHILTRALIPCATKLYSIEKRVSKKIEFWYRSFLVNRYYSQLSDDDVKKHLEILTNHVEKYSPKYAPITLTSNITLPPVQFTQLPKVKYFSIVRPSLHHQPRSHEPTEKNNSSYMLHTREEVFISSRAKGKYDEIQSTIYWPKRESQHLVLVIQNPLPVEFKCRMQIAYKGAEIQLREITLTFEPKQVLEVDVDVLPVCSGTVEFTGYQLVLMGGYKCFVETAKIAPSALKEATLKATIVESVPLLRLRLDEKEVEQQIDVDLWCGEQKEATFLLVSEGKTKPKNVDVALEGKDVQNYSAPMTLSWDKDKLKSSGKTEVHFEFLPPAELITAKNEKSVGLKITYQSTASSGYYRQQDTKILIHYYPLLCLKDVKITPHEDPNKFYIRLIVLNCSPHSVDVESKVSGNSFNAKPYSITRHLMKTRRREDFPHTDDNSDWMKFITDNLQLKWMYHNRHGIIRHDKLSIPRCDWWRTVINVLPMKFSLTNMKNSKPKEVVNPIVLKQGSILHVELNITECEVNMLEELHVVQCVVCDNCEKQPCSHVESDGTSFCVVLGADIRRCRLKSEDEYSVNSNATCLEPEEFQVLACYPGEFSLYFVVKPHSLIKNYYQKNKTTTIASSKSENVSKNSSNEESKPIKPSYVSQKWVIQITKQ